MARMKNYRLDRVLVEQGEAHTAQWTFAGTSMTGTEQWYGVTDGNYPRNNAWEFVLRLPKAAGDRIEVRPRSTPSARENSIRIVIRVLPVVAAITGPRRPLEKS